MSDFGKFVDAFTPAEVAEKVRTVGVDKANMSIIPLVILSLMAGAFISFAAMYYTVWLGTVNGRSGVCAGVYLSGDSRCGIIYR